MRRKPGTLTNLEIAILNAALALAVRGSDDFHGYQAARELKDQEGGSLLTAYGTLYRALERMEGAGLLTSHWEDAAIAESASRPRRRLYRLTPNGMQALESLAKPKAASMLVARPAEL